MWGQGSWPQEGPDQISPNAPQRSAAEGPQSTEAFAEGGPPPTNLTGAGYWFCQLCVSPLLNLSNQTCFSVSHFCPTLETGSLKVKGSGAL